MNILIISIAFPPRNSPGALRPYSWAKYWSRKGHQVTVLTTQKELAPEALILSNNEIGMSTFDVCEVAIPFRPSGQSGNNSRQVSSQSLKYRLFRHLKSIHEMITTVLGPLYDVYLPYVPLLVRAGRKLAQHERFDLLISTFSPAACHLVAHELKKHLHIPWVADYRDFWSGSDFSKGIWPIDVLGSWLEKKTVGTSDLLMAVADPMQEELWRRYHIPCVTVENGFDPEDYDSLDSQNLFPPDGKLRFVYTGALYGRRNPAPFFGAVRDLLNSGHLSKKGLEILFYGRRSDHIPAMAESYGIAGLVKTMGLVDRHTALRAQRDASGLLFFEGRDYTVDYVLPAKIFEFIRSGTPILGIGMDENTTAGRFLVQAGVGFPLETDVDKIKDFLLYNYLPNNKPSLSPNWDFINSYSREKLADKALTYLEKLVHVK